MIKTLLFFLLKAFGVFLLIVLLIAGYVFIYSKGTNGYQVDWLGVKYKYKKHGNEQFIFNSRRLKGVDKSTFEVYNVYYAKDKNQVYYIGKPIKGADPKTFEQKLFGIYELSKDSQNVYHDGVQFSNDATHFESISEYYFKDSQSVFKLIPRPNSNIKYDYIIAPIEEANPKTFRLSPEIDGLSQDDQFVYFKIKKVVGAQPGNLKYLDGCWTDGITVFFHDKILQGINLNTFRALQYPYFTDEEKMFYKSELMEGANPKTFQMVPKTSDYTKDDNQVFYKAHAISNADATSFQKISYYHWKDKNQVYYKSEILPDANPNNFSSLNSSQGSPTSFGKDDQFVFFNGKKLVGANPASFGLNGKDKYGGDQWSDGENKYDRNGKKQ